VNPLVLAGALLAGLWWLILRRFPAPTGMQRRAQGQLLEMLLYSDSVRVLGKVLGDLLLTSLRLLAALLPASLLSLLVTVLVALGLRGYCNWRPPVVGEPFLVSAPAGANLELGPGLGFDSQPLPAGPTTFWRLVASQPGPHQLGLKGGRPVELTVGPAWAYLRPRQAGLTIHYPRREFWLNERRLDWPSAFALCCLGWLAVSGILYVLSSFARRP
jgi:hypothetical protein